MAKVDNEFSFQPNTEQLQVATKVYRALQPQPKLEFIAQPFGGPFQGVTDYFLRVTNTNNGQFDDFSFDLMELWPTGVAITVNDCVARLGFALVPAPVPAVEPVVFHPDTGMPKLQPGQIMTPFGPSK